MQRLKTYYEDNLITLYHGDAREIVPHLEPVDAVITDPVWPNALPELPGSQDPEGVFTAVASYFPQRCTRCVVVLGCNSDPRFLRGVPDAMTFFRAGTLDYCQPSYLGRVLYTGDHFYAFGEPPPSRPGQHLIPGRFMKTTKEPRYQGHPCPRTIGHMRWLVHWFARGTVLDPFAGGCTTAVACQGVGLPCICIEVEEVFCEAAAIRLSTGQGELAMEARKRNDEQRDRLEQIAEDYTD